MLLRIHYSIDTETLNDEKDWLKSMGIFPSVGVPYLRTFLEPTRFFVKVAFIAESATLMLLQLRHGKEKIISTPYRS